MTQAAPGTNWSRNLTYAATEVRRPTTVEDIQEAVTAGGPVRALGSRHCFNDIADTTGTHLLLDRFEPLGATPLTVDRDAAGATTVTVSGGTRYGDLATALATSGYAIHNLASLPHISVAGAIATATHGSGDRNRGLGGAVRAMDIVTGTGEVVHVGTGAGTGSGSGTADGSIPLEAAVVHLGALGVVARVTLAVEPAFEVRQDVFEGLSWDTLAADLDAVTGAAYSVSLFTRWADSGIDQVWLKSRTDATAPGGGVPAYATDTFLGARRSLVPLHPLPGISAVSCTEQLGVAGPSHERLPHFRLNFTPSNGDELQTEYLVPREHALAAIEAVRGLREHVVPLLQITEIRTMAADGLWLSPSGDRDCIALHFTWLPRQREVEAVLPLLEEALAPFDARPHWGKLFTTGADRLAELYPRLGEFRDLAERLDPHGVLRNGYLDRVLPRT